MGVFLFFVFQVFADAPVPELLFRVQLRTGTVVTVRLVTNASHVTHHLVKNDAYELVGGAAVARPIRMMMSDLVQLPSSLMDRSGLVVLPTRGSMEGTPDWILQGLLFGMRTMPEAPRYHLHLTIKVPEEFSIHEFEQAVMKHAGEITPLSQRMELLGPRSARGRNWEGFPTLVSEVPLLPYSKAESVEPRMPLWQEVQRLEREWAEWNAAFEGRPQELTVAERKKLLETIRDLPKKSRAEVRALIADLRLKIANHLTIDEDPMNTLMAAVGRIRRTCSGPLEPSSETH